MDRLAVSAAGAPAAIGPYSHGILAGDTLYVSGQLGIDPESGALEETLQGQTERALKNVGSILAASGMTLANVVKTTVFITDMSQFGTVNEIYGRVFETAAAEKEGFPARSCVQVAELPKGAQVEIEVIAVK